MKCRLLISAVLWFLLFTLIPQTSFAQSQYAATVLADHPVVYYRLDDAPGSVTAVDSSGNGNNGTYQFGPILGVPGLIVDPANTAVNFAGVGDVSVPDASYLHFDNLPFTIEAWVNGTLSETTTTGIFAKLTTGFHPGYGLDISSTSVRLLGCTNLAPAIALNDNTTYHIVGVSNGSSSGAIYVNGALAATGSYSSCAPYFFEGHIGVDDDGTARFNGMIDEVAVYNHALTPGRILAHYAVGVKPIVFTPQSLTFPVQPAGTTSAPKFVKLTNIGSTTVTFNRFTNTGAFKIAGSNCQSTLAAEQSCTIAVEFMPVAAGTYTGLLVINSSAPGSPQTLNLSGTGE